MYDQPSKDVFVEASKLKKTFRASVMAHEMSFFNTLIIKSDSSRNLVVFLESLNYLRPFFLKKDAIIKTNS